MRVFVAGFMAAGKTIVGEELARHFEVPFVDLDARIEAAAASTIERIFAERGEAGFRELESRELVRAAGLDPVVVALGGGALVRAENRRLIRRAGVSVWLDTPRSTILSRLERDESGRPLYVDRQGALELLEERRATYRQCDVRCRPRAGETPAEVAARIAARLMR